MSFEAQKVIGKFQAGDRNTFNLYCRYTPMNCKKPDDNVLFYVSASDDESSYQEYTLSSGKTVKLPVPVAGDSEIATTMNLNNADLATTPTGGYQYIKDEDGNNMKYYSKKTMKDGINSIYVKYLDTAEKCVFVAVDEKTGIFRTFKLWRSGEGSTVILKSVNPAPSTLYLYKNSKGKEFYSTVPSLTKDDANNTCTFEGSIDTQYQPGEKQEYPKTIAKGYPYRRTFYIPYDEVCSIDVNANFPIDSIQGDMSFEAQKVIGKFQAGTGHDNYEAGIDVGSQWSVASLDDKNDPNFKKINSCSSSFEGINIDMKINSEIIVPLRLIVYWK